ncbi:hypothetical protein Fot_06295 [Forsythia ovata]|uniref:Uncharacterized protein n=1 Tax=Forsythia ovata TaxID=205694 RepID=A0ABD1WSJ3_9LAMI
MILTYFNIYKAMYSSLDSQKYDRKNHKGRSIDLTEKCTSPQNCGRCFVHYSCSCKLVGFKDTEEEKQLYEDGKEARGKKTPRLDTLSFDLFFEENKEVLKSPPNSNCRTPTPTIVVLKGPATSEIAPPNSNPDPSVF